MNGDVLQLDRCSLLQLAVAGSNGKKYRGNAGQSSSAQFPAGQKFIPVSGPPPREVSHRNEGGRQPPAPAAWNTAQPEEMKHREQSPIEHQGQDHSRMALQQISTLNRNEWNADKGTYPQDDDANGSLGTESPYPYSYPQDFGAEPANQGPAYQEYYPEQFGVTGGGFMGSPEHLEPTRKYLSTLRGVLALICLLLVVVALSVPNWGECGTFHFGLFQVETSAEGTCSLGFHGYSEAPDFANTFNTGRVLIVLSVPPLLVLLCLPRRSTYRGVISVASVAVAFLLCNTIIMSVVIEDEKMPALIYALSDCSTVPYSPYADSDTSSCSLEVSFSMFAAASALLMLYAFILTYCYNVYDSDFSTQSLWYDDSRSSLLHADHSKYNGGSVHPDRAPGSGSVPQPEKDAESNSSVLSSTAKSSGKSFAKTVGKKFGKFAANKLSSHVPGLSTLHSVGSSDAVTSMGRSVYQGMTGGDGGGGEPTTALPGSGEQQQDAPVFGAGASSATGYNFPTDEGGAGAGN
eukprot:gb/GECG01010312.1/.p1 GENE.gb/GECG01010312.1/~~gb/GECG01010312.1/.p1  ORF type:complete len:519 (+),score=55.95 gb/GECG01010312.1/:1-1557(+)